MSMVNVTRTSYFISSNDEPGKNYYYIHRHIKNFEKSSAMQMFQQQRDLGYLEAKARYKQNYLSNINPVDESAKAYLDAAMNDETIMNDLNQAFTDTLVERMQAVKTPDLVSLINAAHASVDTYVSSRDIRDLDTMFKQIAQAASLLQTENNYLVFLLGRQGYQKDKDLVKLNAMLEEQIAEWSAKKAVLNVSQTRLLSVMKSLQSMVGALAKGKKLDKGSMKSYLNNIFSTQIGEYLVSRNVQKALSLSLKEVRQSLVGSQNVEYREDELTKKMFAEYGQRGSQTYKTDNSFKNIKLQITQNGNSYDYEINLGLSTKWYKTKEGKKIYSAKITDEKSYINRIEQMFKDDQSRYYAYNALALYAQDNSLYEALNDAIGARNADILISGIGLQGDFSQYIVVNNKFYSIWDIINLMQVGFSKQSKRVITVTAPSISAIGDLTSESLKHPDNLYMTYVRNKQQNELINKLELESHFKPDRFINLMK